MLRAAPMLRTALTLCLLFVLAAPASADWNRSQRGQFSADCISSCQANPSVHPSRRSDCRAYCGCVMGEAEKFMSEADYDRLDQLARDGGSDPMLDRFRALFPTCNTRIFGQ
jgi:hypothetical protein